MNHIYKSIFNKALGVFTAVPEFASAHGKGSERTVVGRVAKGTAGFAASALAISIGLALTSTSAVAGPGIYINDGKSDDGCLALPDASGPNVGIYGISNAGGGINVSILAPGQVAPNKDYFAMNAMAPCLSSGNAAQALDTQTNRTLFYGNDSYGYGTITNNGAKNLTLGGRLDVNSGIIGVGDRGTNGAGATNSIRMGTGTTLDEANKHTNAIAIGVNTATTAEGAVAISAEAKARTSYSIAIGRNATAGGDMVPPSNETGGAIAIGRNSLSNFIGAVALGNGATVSPAKSDGNTTDGIAIGTKALVDSYRGMAIGANSQAKGSQSIVLANNAPGAKVSTASGIRSQVYGVESEVSGSNSVAMGSTNTVASHRTYAIGNNINVAAGTDDSLAFGTRAAVGGNNAIAMGNTATATSNYATAIGGEALANGSDGALAIGRKATADANSGAMAIGYDAITTGKSGIAQGYHAYTNAQSGLAIGDNAKASGIGQVAIGYASNAKKADIDKAATAATNKADYTVTVGHYAGADYTGTNNYRSTLIGDNAGRYGEEGIQNIAVGSLAGMYVKGSNNVAMGIGAGAGSATDKLVVNDTTAIGNNAKAVTSESIAIGKNAESGKVDKFDGKKATAIGHEAKALGTGTIAMGAYATSENGHDGVAIGTYAKSSNVKTITIGGYSSASGVQSIAIANNYNSDNSNNSDKSTATGARAIVMGAESHATAERALAIGDKNTVASARTYAIGNNINVAAGADDSLVFGTKAAVGAENTVAIGANANAAQANSVALGAGSTTADVHTTTTPTDAYTLNTSYTAAGLPVAANGTVSVGSAGKERQIQNVAAGVISATSTDAINGSQLYATNNYLSNLAGGVKNVLGGDAAVDNAGNVTMSNIGGTGKGNVNDAIAAANTKVAAGENITVTPTTNTDGSKTYTVATKKDLVVDSVKAGDTTVNTDGVTIANGPSITKSGINANGRKVTGLVDGDINATSTDAVNGSQLHATNTKLADVENTANTAVQEIESANPDALSVKKDGTKVTLTPNVIAGDLVDPATGAVNTPAAGDAGKLVTAGTVANALANTHFVVDTKATNGELDTASQADQKIKSGNKVTLQAGKNLKAKQTNAADGATVEFSLKDSISLTQVTAGTGDNQVVLGNNGVQVGGNTYINKDGLNANSKPISNVADGVKPKDAVNKGQLDAVAQEAAKHTTVKAGKNVEVSEGTNAAGGKEYTVKTADNLNVTSVKAGDSTLNTDGLTITGGPSVKKDGINAGNKKITGVANGNVAAGSTDAVNGGQLAEVKAKADSAVQNVVSANPTALTATKAGDTVTLTPNFIAGNLVDPTTGAVNTPAAGDEGKLVSAKTVADALKANHFVVNTQANGGAVDAASEKNAKVGSGNKVTFEAGKNLVAQQTNTANGGATVNYKLSDTLENLVSVKSAEIEAGIGPNKVVLNNNGVKVGDSTLNDKGLTINNGPSVTDTGIDAGNKKITGVADGNVAAGSTDAVNGGQLAAVKAKADSAVQDIKSGDEKALSVTKAGNTYTITPNLSGDLVDANGNITAPTTPADKGKLVTAGTVADALANTHFVVDTKATDGELDAASQADQKIKASNKVTLQAGKNLKAKQTNGANGAEVEFSLKDSISLKEVKVGEGSANEVVLNNNGVNVAGNTYINKDGLNANGNKVANVKAGDVSATSTDAVNGAQLHNVATSVANVLGGNAAVDGNGNVTSSDIGGTGKGTVHDAIAAVNATAAKHTTVVEGKNVKVTKGKNAAGGDEYTVATKDDLDVTSVTAGNTTVNTNGLTITGGPSVTRGGIDAGNRIISGVKAGDVSATSQEAVNGSQLHATNTKLDGVKAKADTAVQDVKSGDENALTAVKDPNTNIVTVTPKLSGDLVDANGNITAPTTPADKGKLVTAGTVADALANTHFVVDTKATDGELDTASQADQKIKAGNKVTLQAGKNLKAKQTNGANGAQVEFSLKDSISLTQVTAGDSTLNTDGLTIAGGPSVKKDGINAGDKTITNVAPGAVTPTSKDAVNGGQLYNVANNVKDLIGPDAAIDPATGKVTVADPAKGIGETGKGTIGEAIKSVKDKADTAVQDIKSGDEKALSVTKAGNTYTITPNLSGDLVDANGNITAPTTPADKGKLVTAGTVADALANTHFVVDTKATDGELDAASQADQKIKAGNKVTLQAGKNLKAKQTNGANGAQVEFSLKDSISLKEVTAGEGANQVVLGNDGVKVGGNTYINNAGLNANGNKITNVADGVDPTDAVNKSQLDAVKGVADSAVKSVDVANGEQNLVVDNSDPKNPKLSLKKDLTVDSVKAGDSTLNNDGLTIAGGPSVKKDGINAGDKTITNVAPGAVTPTSKDAVNGGQLYNVANNVKDLIGPDATIDPATGKVTVADPAKGIGETGKGNIGDAIKHVNDAAKAAADTAKKHTTVEQGDNILVEESLNANGGKHYKVSTARDLNVDSVKAGDTTVNNDGVTIAGGPSVTKGGINAGGNTITNVADGVNPNDAVNKGQLDAVKGVADSAVKSVDVANGEQNLVVDNSDPKNPKLSLKKDLTVDSVKAGDSTLNNDGLTIAGGPSVKKDGIDAGDKKITNVAAGDVAENSKDAVNGGQLHNVAKGVADVLGGDAAVDGNGKVTMTNIGETGKGNVNDAIKHVNDLAKNAADTAKKHTTVEQGDNILVEESLNANGGKHYKVSTARDLNVDSVKAGDTTVNNDGVTINNGPSMTKDGINANNTKVTNVADGVDAADAVNKGQLDKVDTKVSNVAQNVVNVLGGDAAVNGNGDITMSNIGETGKGNINDAIKSVNDLAKKAAAEKTSVKAKEGRSNVTVTEGVNAAGGHEYTVDVERSVTNAGSDYVTVTNNHDADSNTTTYTVDVSAKTKASLAKADSAVQGLTSKDGNLNFTKGANGNVEVSFNDNLNVKNVTTDRVQVANGPSMSKDGINAAGKAISNVANGNVAADSKDAVNGGQLHETAKSVADVIGGGATVKDGKVVAGQNGIGNTGQNTVHGAIAAINQNTANNFNQIRGDLRKMDRDLRGGIAGALATAGLPQAFRPGKSMVAAAASTYRGQSGLAIGVSRISDNGKVILKVTGNTNSRGDFGGTIGAGYQW